MFPFDISILLYHSGLYCNIRYETDKLNISNLKEKHINSVYWVHVDGIILLSELFIRSSIVTDLSYGSCVS